MTCSQKIKEKAQSLGFELVGIARATPVPDYDFFRSWLDKGYAATMAYLKRGEERRGNPEIILPGVRSVICCGMNYFAGGSGSPISRYAQGDYHRVLGERLQSLEKFIQSEIDPAAKTKSYVDTGPVLEKSYAARAGLGWIGKNTLLINQKIGSFLFLGEILTTLEFEGSDYDSAVPDQCGTCTNCLDACPTGALIAPHLLDAGRCISYLTTALKGTLTAEQKRMIGDHTFGCDICQEVCPFNDGIPVTPLRELQPSPTNMVSNSRWRRTTRKSS